MPWPELWTRRRPPDRHDRGLPVQVQADQVEISQGTPGRRQGRGASAFAAAAAEAEASTRRRLPESAWDGALSEQVHQQNSLLVLPCLCCQLSLQVVLQLLALLPTLLLVCGVTHAAASGLPLPSWRAAV